MNEHCFYTSFVCLLSFVNITIKDNNCKYRAEKNGCMFPYSANELKLVKMSVLEDQVNLFPYIYSVSHWKWWKKSEPDSQKN